MKGSFSDNTDLSRRLFDLLDVVFPGVKEVAQNARAMGAPWESVSTPFVRLQGEHVVSHVGVIEIKLMLFGQVVTVGSIHGVATHPDHRRRRYFGQLMEEAIRHCEGLYETLILTTEHPEYFEPFGFRVIEEHLFTVRCDHPGGREGFRLIETQDARDIALLHRLLETREPVSDVVGVVDEKAVFCFNEGWRPLYFAQDLDAVVCMELEGTRLKLFDIVSPRIPPLTALLERIPKRVEEVSICFSADRLAVEAEVKPYLFDHDGPSYLMARGPFASERPFTLPRSART